MDRIPKPGEFYRHFKNKLYQIIAVATHSETREKMVVYQALYGDYSIYVRPLEMFISEVDHEKYPQVTQKYRFEKVEMTQKENNNTEIETFPNADLKSEASADETDVNPVVLKFIEADTYEEKMQILKEMVGKVKQKDLDMVYISAGLPKQKGEIEGQIYSIMENLRMQRHYDGSRLRR